MKFNRPKMQLKKSRVVYYGMSVGVDGIKPDPAKIRAILEMPDPEDPDAVKRLMGMINFLSPFIPNKSSVTQTPVKESVPNKPPAAPPNVTMATSSSPLSTKQPKVVDSPVRRSSPRVRKPPKWLTDYEVKM